MQISEIRMYIMMIVTAALRSLFWMYWNKNDAIQAKSAKVIKSPNEAAMGVATYNEFITCFHKSTKPDYVFCIK